MPHPRSAARLSRTLVIGCLLVVIALYGLSAPFAAILGSLHTHATPGGSEPPLVLTDFRRSGFAVMTARPAPHTHGLFHTSLQRHRHDPADSSVRSIDAADADDAIGDSGSATTLVSTLIAGAFCGWLLAQHDAGSLRWANARQSPLPVGHARRLERPPQV